MEIVNYVSAASCDVSALALNERFYLTRERGELAYTVFEECLRKTDEGQALVLTFPPHQLIDASFADEAIVRLGEGLVQGEYGERGVLLAGLTADSLHNLNAVLTLRNIKLSLLAIEGKAWQVVGGLEPSLRETLELLATREHLTAPQLSEHRQLAINTASNRLKRLYDQRLIHRTYQVTGKGLEYIYRFWRW
jgi:hypothetical protein